jgi:integrase
MHSSDGLTFAEPKTRASRRAVPLGASAVEALRRHRVTQAGERMRRCPLWQDHDLVFPSAVGTPLDGGNLLQNIHYPLLMRAGLPRLRFHDMRHTAATLMLEQGVHPKIVAERLGHATSTSRSTCTRTSRQRCSGTPPRPWTASWAAPRRNCCRSYC